MAKTEFAPGLPDPRRFGNIMDLPKNRELLYVIQKHLAERAGKHYDIRFGPNLGNEPSLLSWAARKLPEESGQKILAFQQPLHTGAYADFEGKIVSGYGKGTVTTHDKGAVLVTKVEPDKINFVVIHKKQPETFTLIRKSGPPTEGTERTKKTQGGTWLMVNTTPTDIIEHKKIHYSKVPADDIEKLFDPDYLHMEKIDGAAALYKLLSDKIEVLSYRPTTTGRPIVHTYRVGNTTGLNIPKHLVGSILRGELYGVRGRGAIPPQELGGILNSSTLKSLKKQREQKVQLRNAIFNILQYGKAPVGMDVPLAERLDKVREILAHLPEDKFHLPRMAETPEEQRALWKDVSSGKDPLTHEGIVAWPKAGGKPTKVKLYDEHDVFIRNIFPGEKRLENVGAGGFEYSLAPEGPILGRVGTGFSEELRKAMFEHPEEFIGRLARIRAQEQFPSGAYRAPGLIAVHEDYPAKAAQANIKHTRMIPKIKPIRFNSMRKNPTEETDSTMTPSAAEISWDKVHAGAKLTKEAIFGFDFDPVSYNQPSWMAPSQVEKPSWMRAHEPPGSGFGLRESLLGLLLGTRPQTVRDTGSVMNLISNLMGFFRGFGQQRPEYGLFNPRRDWSNYAL